jgi:hypothetical protein
LRPGPGILIRSGQKLTFKCSEVLERKESEHPKNWEKTTSWNQTSRKRTDARCGPGCGSRSRLLTLAEMSQKSDWVIWGAVDWLSSYRADHGDIFVGPGHSWILTSIWICNPLQISIMIGKVVIWSFQWIFEAILIGDFSWNE